MTPKILKVKKKDKTKGHEQKYDFNVTKQMDNYSAWEPIWPNLFGLDTTRNKLATKSSSLTCSTGCRD